MYAAKAYKFDPAFTLVEMMIVAAIVALLAAGTVPKFTGWLKSSRIDAAAGHMAGVLRRAHNVAAVTGKKHRVVLDLEGGAYSVEREGEEGDFEAAPDRMFRRVVLARGIVFKDVTFPSGDMLTTGKAAIEVFPKGFMDEILVHLADESGRERTVLVRGWLGRVKVLSGYRDWRTVEG